MSRIGLRRLPDGAVELRDWPLWGAQLVEVLVELADPDPRGPAGERIYPRAYPSRDDDAREAEWRKSAAPEIRALLASARETVGADLAAASRGPRGALKLLTIPAAHVPAWIAALQTARLRIAADHDVDAGAMRAPPEELTEAVRGPVELIDLFASMQGFLLDGLPEATDASEPDGSPGPGGT